MFEAVIYWGICFYIYSLCGWFIETIIVSIDEKSLADRGFLHLPMLPIYGFCGLIIHFSTYFFIKSPVLVFLIGAVAVTIFEFLTGIFLSKFFKKRYWNYSKSDHQILGIISLESSLFWGFLSLVLMYNLYPITERMVKAIPQREMLYLFVIMSIFFILDVAISVKNELKTAN